jgi:hypothetical protein
MADISNIRFSIYSRNAIEEIRDLQGMANTLSIFIGASAILDIFGGNGVLLSSYKVYTSDFESLAQSMRASNPILVRRVEDIAMRMYMNPSLNREEKMFWRALYNEMR